MQTVLCNHPQYKDKTFEINIDKTADAVNDLDHFSFYFMERVDRPVQELPLFEKTNITLSFNRTKPGHIIYVSHHSTKILNRNLNYGAVSVLHYNCVENRCKIYSRYYPQAFNNHLFYVAAEGAFNLCHMNPVLKDCKQQITIILEDKVCYNAITSAKKPTTSRVLATMFARIKTLAGKSCTRFDIKAVLRRPPTDTHSGQETQGWLSGAHSAVILPCAPESQTAMRFIGSKRHC